MSSALRQRVDDGGGGEVPPLLGGDGYFMNSVRVAVRNYDVDMLQRITDKYTVDAQDEDGYTMLMHAVYYGNVASVRFLIERGAAVNIQDTHVKWTALHYACDPYDDDVSDDEFEEMVLLLLCAGADTTIKNWDGMTPRDQL